MEFHWVMSSLSNLLAVSCPNRPAESRSAGMQYRPGSSGNTPLAAILPALGRSCITGACLTPTVVVLSGGDHTKISTITIPNHGSRHVVQSFQYPVICFVVLLSLLGTAIQSELQNNFQRWLFDHVLGLIFGFSTFDHLCIFVFLELVDYPRLYHRIKFQPKKNIINL